MAAEKPTINITIISDMICPWCYVAKKNLATAMNQVADRFNFNVSLEPFLLKQDIPPEGMDKPPVAPGKSRVSENLKKAGEDAGIDFTGKAEKYPYTIPMHALLEYAAQHGKQSELADNLYKAYFTDGTFLDTDQLVKFATELGLNLEEVHHVITDTATLEEAAAKAKAWRSKDITGIPCFFMNGVKTISGSESPDHFVKMFEIVAQNYPQ